LLVKPADAVLGPVEPGDDAKAGLFEHRPHRVGSEQKVRLRITCPRHREVQSFP
jgi:hypothetical protein